MPFFSYMEISKNFLHFFTRLLQFLFLNKTERDRLTRLDEPVSLNLMESQLAFLSGKSTMATELYSAWARAIASLKSRVSVKISLV